MRRGLLVLAASALAACAQLQAPTSQTPAPVVEADESRQVAELLGYYQRVAQLAPEEQKRELAAATQSFNRERSPANRVRLALLYTIPGTAFQDDARAVQLLEPVTTTGGGAVRSLANLLQAQVSERLKSQKQLKEQLEASQKRADQLKEQQEATQRRADQLKEQMEALRAVEKQLLERGQQATPRRP